MSTSRSAARMALRKLRTAARPNVHVTPPPPDMVVQFDLPVPMRDSTILRINVFRPRGHEPVPAIMSAHPYGKDNLPLASRRGTSVALQYHLAPQPDPITFSAYTGWEAPDPAVYTARGYAVVNCDLRGAGTSDGVGQPFSAQEGNDYYDLIEWVAAQPWCSGRVGLDGVSYLAISQYWAAAAGPPTLAAICPWEGMTDPYRDTFFPGGVREIGFSTLWSRVTSKSMRTDGDLAQAAGAHPERDGFWEAKCPTLEAIDVPLLICASFSDQSLHTRGAFEAYRRSGSGQKWLYTHRRGKWSTYYGADATATRLAFFDHFLKGLDNGWERRPSVRLAIHEDGDQPAVVTGETQWPPQDLSLRELRLDAASATLPGSGNAIAFVLPNGKVDFEWVIEEDLDVIGAMGLVVPVSLEGTDDMHLFVRVDKLRDGREVLFEGTMGFPRDSVSKGWQRLAHRELAAEATPLQPVHTACRAEPVRPGEVVEVQVELRQHATRFRRGDVLRVRVSGSWPFRSNRLTGTFAFAYVPSDQGRALIHLGGRLAFACRPSAVSDRKSQ